MASKMIWSHEVARNIMQEQELLKKLKEEKGINSWKKIAVMINTACKDFSKTGKQYRDRYVNYIRFNDNCPKVTEWTPQEQIHFFQNYFEHGSKWVQISLELAGRSENNLKNKFYGIIRKVTRRIQKFQKNLKPKPKKFITQKYIIKAIDECRKISYLKEENGPIIKGLAYSGMILKQRLINLILNMCEETSDQEIQEAISIFRGLYTYSLKNQVEPKSNINSLQSQMEIHSTQHKSDIKNVMEAGQQSQMSKIFEGNVLQKDIQFKQKAKQMDMIEDLEQYPSKTSQPQDLMQELCSILQCVYVPCAYNPL